MTREERVAVVEAYLDCVVRKDFDRLPIAPGYTSQTPLSPELSGAAAVEYLKRVAQALNGINIIQHIVEGDHIATLFEEDTTFGKLLVFSKFQLEQGRIKDARVFYDPRKIPGISS